MKKFIKSNKVLVTTLAAAITAGAGVVASPEVVALLQSILTSISGG